MLGAHTGMDRVLSGEPMGRALARRPRLADTAARALLHERTLADRERMLGPDHPDTLTSRGDLAVAYQDAGRAAEAIPLHEQTLAACERVLGLDHPPHPDLAAQPRRRQAGGGPGSEAADAARTCETWALMNR